MNLDQIEGGLWQTTGKVKEQWGMLIRNPSVAAAGRRDQVAGRVQERRGNAQQEAARQLREFMRRNRNWHVLNR